MPNGFVHLQSYGDVQQVPVAVLRSSGKVGAIRVDEVEVGMSRVFNWGIRMEVVAIRANERRTAFYFTYKDEKGKEWPSKGSMRPNTLIAAVAPR